MEGAVGNGDRAGHQRRGLLRRLLVLGVCADSVLVMTQGEMNQRQAFLLTTALVGALLPTDVPEGRMVRAWLDSWSGIGHVTTGMARKGYDLALTSYDGENWRATF